MKRDLVMREWQERQWPGVRGRGSKTDTVTLPRASLGLQDESRDDGPRPVASEFLALGLDGMVRGQGQGSLGAMEGSLFSSAEEIPGQVTA